MDNPTSRNVLFGTASALVANALSVPPARAQTQYVRQSIAEFSKDPAKVEGFRAGVRAMKSRGAWNATSWAYQANMHGVPPGTTLRPGWATCDHGTWFFLPWHRMYVYWLEQILRQASGDPNFALPYWNYADPAQRLLPPIFRQPADSSNPLYEANRRSGINSGTRGLAFADVDVRTAFAQDAFSSTSSPYAFGGYPRAPSHASGTHGALESSPHDNVHDAIGGYMHDINKAARDPIFWLHHANVDRLWNKWLSSRTHSNPTASNWLDQRFTFFDAQRTAVTESVRQFMSTRASEYRYDTEPAPTMSMTVAESSDLSIMGDGGSGAMATQVTLARSNRLVELGARPVSIPLAPTAPMGEPPEAPRQLFLTISKIHSKTPPGSSFDVYLNLPAGTKPGPDEEVYFVGRLSFFARMAQGDSHAAHDEGPSIRAFDITALARRQADAGAWRQAPAITIVAVYPEDIVEGAGARLGGIEITRR